ncbi:VWA domain-containing protein [Motilimonas pumila]|uniref:VWA domain-containing protein n=1 Tax=Motilimonas pumila TaxID=2303987 RepID=A0A418YG96_9GAMM|nr:VWA domain-containing protein [Motilimonas pumila]RJG48675.1 VWA domain-containing protein [Motilimonas pumila]
MFEFLRPLFLLLIPVVMALFIWLKRHQGQASLKHLIAPHLATRLIQGQRGHNQLHWWVLYLGIVASIALAGPSFRQVEVPIVQLKQARVIVMDMSMSMYATDLTPNRLTQAKYKALDLIGQQTEGEQGLIAYAGDAFTISPLTQDNATILNLLPNLSPDIMPKPGSNPVAGLHRAIALLQNAGYQDGDIIFITDGISRAHSQQMADIVGQSSWRLSFLAAGSKKGAPITQPNGDLLKDNAGNIVIPQLKLAPLRQLARQTGGTLVTLSSSDKDISALNQFAFNVAKDAAEKSEQQSLQAIDDGYWLMFLLAPFVLFGFRRGHLFSVALIAACFLPKPGYSQSQSIWQNTQQNAYQAFQQQDYETAAQLYQEPLAKGAAYFKAEQYDEAKAQFSKLDSANAWYNLGNTQVKLEDYDAALKSYETALQREPGHVSAQQNLTRLKDWLAQQEQQEQQDSQSQDEQESQDSQDSQSQDEQANQDAQDSQNQDEQPNQDAQDSQSQDEQQNQDAQDSQNQDEQQNQDAQDSQNQDEQQNQDAPDSQNQDAQDPQSQSEESQQAQTQPEVSPQGEDQQASAVASPEPSPEPAPADAQPSIAQGVENNDEAAAEPTEPLPAWLQQMADDPSILLRNKMRLEYQKRDKFTEEGETW